MKLLALAAPLLVLGLVLLLQRMEAWCTRAPTAAGRIHRPAPGGRTPATTTRSTMRNPAAPSPAATVDEEVAEPLLRDPPAPPGYVDPLSGSSMLEHLVGSASGQRGPRTHAASRPADS